MKKQIGVSVIIAGVVALGAVYFAYKTRDKEVNVNDAVEELKDVVEN